MLALFTNSTFIVCESPASVNNTAQILSVELSTSAERMFVSTEKTFEYVIPPIVQAILPLRGNNRGGTIVTMSGSNFHISDTICMFGSSGSVQVYIPK